MFKLWQLSEIGDTQCVIIQNMLNNIPLPKWNLEGKNQKELA